MDFLPSGVERAGRSGAERNLAKLTREIDRALVSAANATLKEAGAKKDLCFLRVPSLLIMKRKHQAITETYCKSL